MEGRSSENVTSLCEHSLGRMTEQIKAAVCHTFGGPLSIDTVTLADPGPGEIKVRVKACAICHSDIIYADGGWGGDLPMVLGHEAAGIVEATGPGVTRAKIGDHVAVTLVRSCGECHYCERNSEFLCEQIFALDEQSPLSARGNDLVHGLRTGAFAEAVVVEQSQVVPIAGDLDFDAASLLSCGAITGVGAVTNTAKMPAGSHVVVIGCGGVGLNTVQGARIAGASTITAIDLFADKLEAAKVFGATHVCDPAVDDPVQLVMETTAGRGADFVFVTVGAKAAIDGAQSYLGKGGTAVVVGMPETGVMAVFDPVVLAASGQRILGSKMGSASISRDIPKLARLYQSGALLLDEMITNRFVLAEINKAIASTKSGDALRNVIVFD